MAANSSQAPQSSSNSAAIRNMNEQLDAYILWRTQLPPPPQVRAAHNQNIYQCEYCPRTFASAQALGGHLNAHRTERNAERAFALRQRRLARLRQTPFVFFPPPATAAPPFLYPAPLAVAPPPAVQVGPNYGLAPWFYPGVGCYVYNHNYGYGNNHGYYYGYGPHHATPVPVPGFHPGGQGYLTRVNRDRRDNRSNIPNGNDHEVSLFEFIFGPEREAMPAAGEGTSGGDGDEGGDEGVPLKRTRRFF